MDDLQAILLKDMPEFILALEAEPDATLSYLGLQVKGFEPLEKLVLCQHPGDNDIGWDWCYQPPGQPANSCAVLYWPEVKMRPDERRTFAFTYGLGRLANQVDHLACPPGGRMRLFCHPGEVQQGKPFTVTALIKPTDPDQTVTLKLPFDVVLRPEQQQAQRTGPPAGPQGYSHVTWRVLARSYGAFSIVVEGPTMGVATEKVFVSSGHI
jgi:hypothetical protein